MSGETEKVSGWTTDTLRAALLDVLKTNNERLENALEAQAQAGQVAFVGMQAAMNASLRAQADYFEVNKENMKEALSERDLRYGQRFDAQMMRIDDLATRNGARFDNLHRDILALDVRISKEFVSRDNFLTKLAEERQTQVSAAFVAQEAATLTSLKAAETAVAKAEAATEKRFEGVNEFRAQLSDQAREFMPRRESELQISTLSTRVETIQKTLQEAASDTMPRGEIRVVLDGLNNRVDGLGNTITNLSTVLASLRASITGQSQGGDEVRESLTRSRNLAIGIAGVLIAVSGVAITLILALKH